MAAQPESITSVAEAQNSSSPRGYSNSERVSTASNDVLMVWLAIRRVRMSSSRLAFWLAVMGTVPRSLIMFWIRRST